MTRYAAAGLGLRQRECGDVFPAHPGARQVARPFRVVRALRGGRRHAGARRRGLARVGSGEARRGGPAPGYRPACLVAEDRRLRLAIRGVNTLQAVRSVARIGVKPRTLAARHRGRRRLAEPRGTAPGTVHRQQHRARYPLGDRGRRRARRRAETITAQVRTFFEAALRGGRVRRGAAWRKPSSSSATGAIPRPVSSATDEFQFMIGFAAARAPRNFTAFAYRTRRRAAGFRPSASTASPWPSIVRRNSSGWRTELAEPARAALDAPRPRFQFGRERTHVACFDDRGAPAGAAGVADSRGHGTHRHSLTRWRDRMHANRANRRSRAVA